MTRTIKALQVTVTAEQLPHGKEAYSVEIDAHGKVPASWIVSMLRQIADGIETDPEPTDSGHGE